MLTPTTTDGQNILDGFRDFSVVRLLRNGTIPSDVQVYILGYLTNKNNMAIIRALYSKESNALLYIVKTFCLLRKDNKKELISVLESTLCLYANQFNQPSKKISESFLIESFSSIFNANKPNTEAPYTTNLTISAQELIDGIMYIGNWYDRAKNKSTEATAGLFNLKQLIAPPIVITLIYGFIFEMSRAKDIASFTKALVFTMMSFRVIQPFVKQSNLMQVIAFAIGIPLISFFILEMSRAKDIGSFTKALVFAMMSSLFLGPLLLRQFHDFKHSRDITQERNNEAIPLIKLLEPAVEKTDKETALFLLENSNDTKRCSNSLETELLEAVVIKEQPMITRLFNFFSSYIQPQESHHHDYKKHN